MSVQHQPALVFRAPRNYVELADLFRLRYNGYLESSCSSLVEENNNGFEIDIYDWQSLHLGLFQEERKKSTPIAYARVVQEKMGEHSDLVNKLLSITPGLKIKAPSDDKCSLPMLGNCGERALIEEQLQTIRANGARLVEASRLVFAPEARLDGYAKTFVESAMAATFAFTDADVIALACHPRHVPFYIRYGFKLILDGRKNDYNGLQASIILLDRNGIHPGRADKIQQLGKMLSRGKIIYMPPMNTNTQRVAPGMLATV